MTSPRNLPRVDRSNNAVQIVSMNSITNSAGSRRRARLIQKCFMSTRFVCSFSEISSSVIR